jgi:hypothetical protein
MAGQLKILVGSVQTMNVWFVCQVQITGGLALDDVVVRVWESAGVSPLFRSTKGTTLDAAGNGMIAFDVRLDGPCTARLVADDVKSASPLAMDDVHIEVVR